MAGGYLGKISAVISANTGDYVRKLGESAKETTNFARTVERTLSRASSEAAKSLQGIYTPLQQFERALRAAASERLSFKGFDGAIRTVEELKKRLAGIKASDVDIVVKASGQKTLTDLRNVINDISSRDIDLFRNVGGLAGLQKARAEIEALSQRTDIVVKPKVSLEQIDGLIAKFSQIDDTQINAVIRVFGERELDAALTKARQARDVFEQVTSPLSRTVQTFSQLSGQVQGEFAPALGRAQREAERLASSFSPERYAAATRSVASLTTAVGQLSEAQRLAAQVPTGRELAFSDPRLNANLRAAAGAGQQAAALPASAIAGDPEFSGLTSQLNRVSELAVAAAARLKSLRETDAPGQSQAAAEFDRLNGVLEQLTSRLNQKFQVRLDAEKAIADAQKLDQAISQFRLEIASGSLNVLQNESRAISQTGESLAAYESRLQAASDARMRASATGQMFLNVLQRESQALSGSGEADLAAYEARLRSQVAARMRASAAGEMFLNVLQRESQALSGSGEADLAAYEARLRSQADARMRASAAGEMFLNVLQRESDLLSRFGNVQAGELAQRRMTTAANFSQSFGGGSVAGVELGLQSQTLQSYNAQLRLLQNTISGLSSEARGPALASFVALEAAISRAFRNGTLDSQATQEEIATLRNEAVSAVAAVANINASRLGEDLRRSGDIGRGGVDRLSLALNQAAFAVDDFLSSTGGIEFKIRAVSNNITQLAFVLGGTQGLFIGLGAVLASQVAVGIAKFAFNTQDAQKRTEALNEALSRQKSLVEQLASAYRDLSRSIASNAESRQQGVRRSRDEQFQEISNRARDLQRERIAQTNPRVAALRVEQQAVQQRLQEPQGIFETGEAFRTRRQSLQRRLEVLRQQEDAIASRSRVNTVSREEAIRVLSTTGPGGLANARVGLRLAGADVQGAADRLLAAGDRGDAAGFGIQGQRDRLSALRDQLSIFEQLRQDIQSAPEAERIAGTREIDAEIGRLQEVISRFTDVFDQDVVIAERIGRRLFDVSDTIGRGRDLLSTAFDGLVGSSAIQAELDRLSEVVGMFSDLASEAVMNGQNPAEFMAGARGAEEMANAMLAAAVAVSAFSEELGKIRESTAQDVGSLQQRAEQARREDIRLGTPDTAQRRSQAEADLRAGRGAQRQVEISVQNALERAEQQIIANGTRLGERLRQIDQQLAVPAGQVSTTGVQGGTLEERQRLRQERSRLQAQAAVAVENDPFVREARFRQDRLTRQAEAAAGADRGRQIGLTDSQRAIEQAQAQLADVRDRAGEIRRAGRGNQDIAGLLRQSRENLGRDVAPSIFSMADQVMNAALQGPSRAALTASDISTSQGASELNRLARGDDQNRNANILELQKQNSTLTAINEGIKQMADNMGIVLDL